MKEMAAIYNVIKAEKKGERKKVHNLLHTKYYMQNN